MTRDERIVAEVGLQAADRMLADWERCGVDVTTVELRDLLAVVWMDGQAAGLSEAAAKLAELVAETRR